MCFLHSLDTITYLLEFSCFLHCRNVTITAGSIISFNVSNFQSASWIKRWFNVFVAFLWLANSRKWCLYLSCWYSYCSVLLQVSSLHCVLLSGVFFCLIMEDNQSEVSVQSIEYTWKLVLNHFNRWFSGRGWAWHSLPPWGENHAKETNRGWRRFRNGWTFSCRKAHTWTARWLVVP